MMDLLTIERIILDFLLLVGGGGLASGWTTTDCQRYTIN